MNFPMVLGMMLFIMGTILLLPPMQRRAIERNMRFVVLTPFIHMFFGFLTFMIGALFL